MRACVGWRAQTAVQVHFLPDGASHHVTVDESMTGGELCRLMMKRRNVPLMTSWSVLEQLPDMLIGNRPDRTHTTPGVGPDLQNILRFIVRLLCLQCFDAVGWATGRASSL